jgi:hypothetical protein
VFNEQNADPQIPNVNAVPAGEEEEFEEITSDEVDRVVEQLEALIESVSSENIRFYLEEATNNIYGLIYDETDAEEDLADAA